jgi:hypothetical protein
MLPMFKTKQDSSARLPIERTLIRPDQESGLYHYVLDEFVLGSNVIAGDDIQKIQPRKNKKNRHSIFIILNEAPNGLFPLKHKRHITIDRMYTTNDKGITTLPYCHYTEIYQDRSVSSEMYVLHASFNLMGVLLSTKVVKHVDSQKIDITNDVDIEQVDSRIVRAFEIINNLLDTKQLKITALKTKAEQLERLLYENISGHKSKPIQDYNVKQSTIFAEYRLVTRLFYVYNEKTLGIYKHHLEEMLDTKVSLDVTQVREHESSDSEDEALFEHQDIALTSKTTVSTRPVTPIDFDKILMEFRTILFEETARSPEQTILFMVRIDEIHLELVYLVFGGQLNQSQLATAEDLLCKAQIILSREDSLDKFKVFDVSEEFIYENFHRLEHKLPESFFKDAINKAVNSTAATDREMFIRICDFFKTNSTHYSKAIARLNIKERTRDISEAANKMQTCYRNGSLDVLFMLLRHGVNIFIRIKRPGSIDKTVFEEFVDYIFKDHQNELQARNAEEASLIISKFERIIAEIIKPEYTNGSFFANVQLTGTVIDFKKSNGAAKPASADILGYAFSRGFPANSIKCIINSMQPKDIFLTGLLPCVNGLIHENDGWNYVINDNFGGEQRVLVPQFRHKDMAWHHICEQSLKPSSGKITPTIYIFIETQDHPAIAMRAELFRSIMKLLMVKMNAMGYDEFLSELRKFKLLDKLKLLVCKRPPDEHFVKHYLKMVEMFILMATDGTKPGQDMVSNCYYSYAASIFREGKVLSEQGNEYGVALRAAILDRFPDFEQTIAPRGDLYLAHIKAIHEHNNRLRLTRV